MGEGAGGEASWEAPVVVEVARRSLDPVVHFFPPRRPCDAERAIELEGERAELGCAESSCLAEIAGALGADLVVFGDVSRLDALLVVNLNVFDSTQATSVARSSFTAGSIDEVPRKLEPATPSTRR